MYSKTYIQGSFENIKSILFLLKVYTLVIIWMKCSLIDQSIYCKICNDKYNVSNIESIIV